MEILMFPAVFNLANLDGKNGFVINELGLGDDSSWSSNTVGDINGDGIADIVVGSPWANNKAGQSSVVFGSRNGFTSPFSLSSLNGANGFAINGINSGDYSGDSISAVGDVNGDGIADMIIGTPIVNNNTGQSYVVFGSRSGFTSPFSLSSLNGANGFVINGITDGDRSGFSVSMAGDVNADGIADIIVGAPWANNKVGQSYVVFGSRSGFTSLFSLSSLNGANGFVINGINSDDYSGRSVSTAGDVNGDGIADIIIGARNANQSAGQAYVVFGSSKGFASPSSLSGLNGQNGFVLNGITTNDNSGWSVSTAGDVNGDGVSDIIIGTPWSNNVVGTDQIFVVFGSSDRFASQFNLASLNGNNGFIINSIHSRDFMDSVVSTAGDVNNDGIADIIIGARNANHGAGQSYVIFGSSNRFVPAFNLGNLNGANGFTINTINSGDPIGASVSTAGDVNGDGIADIIIGEYNENNNAGQSYVIFGTSQCLPPTPNQECASCTDNGAIAGGVIGGLIGGATLAFVGWWAYHKYYLHNGETQHLIGEAYDVAHQYGT
jgi:hypothetical protein